MCGHVGVAGDLNSASVDAFKDLLFFDTVRGAHGTGIASVPWAKGSREPDDCKIIKAPVDAPTFLGIEAVKTMLRSTSHSVLIGHNRHATKGEHIFENTHPFMTENIVGAHNGTVSDLSDLTFDGSWGTDSEEILNNISENGIKDTLSKLRSGYSGAWALVYYDFTTNEICMVRNDERTLCFALSEDKKQLFWASEANMLRLACARKGRVKLDTIYSLPINVEFRWAVPAVGEEFGKEERVTVKPKKPLPPASYRGGVTNSYRNNYSNVHGFSQNKRKVDTSKSSLASSVGLVLEPYEMSEGELLEVFSKGTAFCCWCTSNVDSDDKGTVAVAPKSILCGSCAKEVELQKAYESNRTA